MSQPGVHEHPPFGVIDDVNVDRHAVAGAHQVVVDDTRLGPEVDEVAFLGLPAEFGIDIHLDAAPVDLVLLAQHADDQAETVLHQALRGTGLKGISGMGATRRLAGGPIRAGKSRNAASFGKRR